MQARARGTGKTGARSGGQAAQAKPTRRLAAQQDKVLLEQYLTVRKMRLAILRPGEVARAEWGVEHQIIHDLIISLTDRLLAPASPLGELKQVDLLIIERAAQDRESDCGRQKEYRQYN